jgi:hypothetical protein
MRLGVKLTWQSVRVKRVQISVVAAGRGQGKQPPPKLPDDGGATCQTRLLGDHSGREPPDPIPNSEVKPPSADDSVAVCHAKVGNRQAPYT